VFCESDHCLKMTVGVKIVLRFILRSSVNRAPELLALLHLFHFARLHVCTFYSLYVAKMFHSMRNTVYLAVWGECPGGRPRLTRPGECPSSLSSTCVERAEMFCKIFAALHSVIVMTMPTTTTTTTTTKIRFSFDPSAGP